MYSTNLHIAEGDGTYIWDDTKPVGTAFGNEIIERDKTGKPIKVGPASQTAKDNALLWSCAPELISLLSEAYHNFYGTPNLWHLRTTDLLNKLAHAIPPASVAQNG